jgi:prolyl-tRNA editing enzyme YbaK/EbsC (Cys-tRNA(Pro) deacylase)
MTLPVPAAPPPAVGSLDLVPAMDRPDLLAPAVAAALAASPELAAAAWVAPIDADLADTAAFCAAYGVAPEASANCVVVRGTRGGDARTAACLVLATTRADVNGVVRRLLDVRKLSFAPMDDAVAETGMEYGGITPIGLPDSWPVLIDARVPDLAWAVVGSGIRGSKIVVAGAALGALVGAQIVEGLARDVGA